MKKLSLAELAEKSNAVTTSEILNAIRGGELTQCHDGNCRNKVEHSGDPHENISG